MAAAPRVSVVMIFLDAERFLRQAVDSVRQQSFRDWELLLVDDGSSDASGRIAGEYVTADPGRIRYLQHEGGSNRGMSASRNLGVAHARGEWVALLDADDEWRPEHLALLLDEARQHPRAEVIYGPALVWHSWDPATSERDSVQDIARNELSAAGTRPAVACVYLRHTGAVPCTGATIVRRETYERLGGFESAFAGMCEDQVFAFKVALDANVTVTPHITLLYRRHDQSCCAVSFKQKSDVQARITFLKWARRYAAARAPETADVLALIGDQLWHARRSVGLLRLVDRAVRRVAPSSALNWIRGRRAPIRGVR